ncbi:LacI family DNA-binding transcriptional regulator [Metabacillus sp. Hm71]|uniref:LacI family DNA-binding transcriptional regulator n=1 Tax=Metabacillus sp. Hm71 TaxID=3450743 RepID=UPI003F42797C
MNSRINAYDVARKAKVSQSTVSRVLNHYPYIKEETRRKVLTAIKELNFTRDEIARSLAEKKTRTIGLIVGDITNPFYAESSDIIMRKAKEQEYDVIIGYTNYRSENLDKTIQTMIGKRVDGILIGTVNRSNKRVKELFQSGFPTVLYNSTVDNYEQANYIILNNEKGAYMATEHLIELGHREIAYISGPETFLNLDRQHIGYKKALKKYGIQYNENLVYQGALSYHEIIHFVDKLFSSTNRPTSIFVNSDQMALAIIDAVTKLNLEVPKDLSIIGFDNINLASNHMISLTTVSQSIDTMAFLALEHLLLIIEGKETIDTPIQIEIEPELIIRKTTGPAALHVINTSK